MQQKLARLHQPKVSAGISQFSRSFHSLFRLFLARFGSIAIPQEVPDDELSTRLQLRTPTFPADAPMRGVVG